MPHTSFPIGGQELFSSSATPVHKLGEKVYSKRGDSYRYVKAGELLVTGLVCQSPAVAANHITIDVAAAAAIGATQVTVTLGATAATANQYADGTISIDTTPGQGQQCRIKSHPAADASGSLTLTLYPEDALRVALTTSSDATLVANSYNGVIKTPATTLTGHPVGVAIYPVASGEYGWIQTGGRATVLVGGTPIVGALVVSPGDTAGEVVVDPANAAVDVFGTILCAGEDGKYLPIHMYER